MKNDRLIYSCAGLALSEEQAAVVASVQAAQAAAAAAEGQLVVEPLLFDPESDIAVQATAEQAVGAKHHHHHHHRHLLQSTTEFASPWPFLVS